VVVRRRRRRRRRSAVVFVVVEESINLYDCIKKRRMIVEGVNINHTNETREWMT
jgi:hypothetical protein